MEYRMKTVAQKTVQGSITVEDLRDAVESEVGGDVTTPVETPAPGATFKVFLVKNKKKPVEISGKDKLVFEFQWEESEETGGEGRKD